MSLVLATEAELNAAVFPFFLRHRLDCAALLKPVQSSAKLRGRQIESPPRALAYEKHFGLREACGHEDSPEGTVGERCVPCTSFNLFVP
jgi:hypothetical protein